MNRSPGAYNKYKKNRAFESTTPEKLKKDKYHKEELNVFIKKSPKISKINNNNINDRGKGNFGNKEEINKVKQVSQSQNLVIKNYFQDENEKKQSSFDRLQEKLNHLEQKINSVNRKNNAISSSYSNSPLRNKNDRTPQKEKSNNYNMNQNKITTVKKYDGQNSKEYNNYYIDKSLEAFKYKKSNDYFHNLFRNHFSQITREIVISKVIKHNGLISKAKSLFLEKKDCYKGKKTIVFDMDETMIHSVDLYRSKADVLIPIKFPYQKSIKAGINIRPYLFETLKTLSEHYELMVFTASQSSYANPILDFIDPKKEYFQHRLYRNNCSLSEQGFFVKDLRIISNRSLQDMVLVDNSAASFAFQMENGIPMLPFYDNKNDNELKGLTQFLLSLEFISDVRTVLKEKFKLSELTTLVEPSNLVKQLYNKEELK